MTPSPPGSAAGFALRSYQRDALEAIDAAWAEKPSTLVVMPTGTGKTILFAHLISLRSTKRAIVIAHRKELLHQNAEKIAAISGFRVEIDQAENYAHQAHARVVVASVQTQVAAMGDEKRRMHRWNPADFDLLIIDEAHHATAASYRAVIEHFRTNPRLHVLGVTATPDRADEEALGQIFETVAKDYEVLDALRDGWLVRPVVKAIHVEDLDLSTIRTTQQEHGADLAPGELAAALAEDRVLHEMVWPTFREAGARKTIVFAAGVDHAAGFAQLLNEQEPGCARFVCGETPKWDRDELFADFAANRFRFLCNVGVATEGFDAPDVACIAMARPTKSRALYAQMAGRGLRPLAGVVDGPATDVARREAIAASAKPDVLLLDFVGNAGRHQLMSAADILGGKATDAVLTTARRCTGDGQAHDVLNALEDAERIFANEEERRQQRHERKTRRFSVRSLYYASGPIDPFAMLDIKPERERAWHKGRKLSEKQTAMLEKYRVDPRVLTYTQGQQVIKAIIDRDLCTPKQGALLRRYGYDPEEVTFTKARELIDAIAANGWRRPPTTK